jgi:hypothetical protein
MKGRRAMAEHPVRRTLGRDLLPYLVSARRLRRQWFYRLHVIFGYTTDLVVALTAIGISTPLLSLVGSLSDTKKDMTQSPSLIDVLNSIPGWLIYPAGLAVVVWIVLRVTFNREEGQKRAVLAKSCFYQLRQAEASLPTILSKSDPRPEITSLLEKTIRPPVDRNIQEKAWPWTPFAPGIDAEVVVELDALCSKYEADWMLIDSPILQQRT